jgi:uncharacterized protein (TIGR02217 family)
VPTTLPFSEARLPTALSFVSEFGPEFATSVVALLEDATQRNSHWRQDRPRGNVQYSVRTLAYLQQLSAFAHARRGEAQAFRVKVRWDYQAEAQFLGLGDGGATQFQLQKFYSSGGPEDYYLRKITKPVGIGYPIGNTYDSVALYQDDIWMPSGYTIDYTTGGIALDTPLAADVVLTATYEYDWPMRFATSTILTSLQAITTQLAQSTTPPPGPPQYFILADQSGAWWFYWIDTRGAIARLDAAPPVPPFTDLTVGQPPSWLGVSDETTLTWYLFPDELGQLTADTTPPPLGTGINYNVPLPFPLAGLQLRGEDGQTLYTLAADSAGEPYVYHTMTEDAVAAFDALGMTEPIPLIGVK